MERLNPQVTPARLDTQHPAYRHERRAGRYLKCDGDIDFDGSVNYYLHTFKRCGDCV